MSWRVAESLKVLLAEVNAMAPERSKASDGAIGDAAHATRSSDHNPWVVDGSVGVVTARDITHDPAHGCDASRLAEHFRALGKAGDARIKYVIWNRQICSFIENWQWRAYSGTNPHTKHVHLSVASQKRHYDSTKPWGLRPEPPTPATPPVQEDDDMRADETLTFGQWGEDVLRQPDGEITVAEGEAIKVIAAAQTNESVYAMAKQLAKLAEGQAAQQKTLEAILAALKKPTG